VSVSLALGVGSSEAASEGKVGSPLPCFCLGLPFVPSDAVGVGSSHSTSSARFGPCPPLRRLSGCCEPPFFPRLLVGVFSKLGRPGGKETPLTAVGRTDIAGAKNAPPCVIPDVGKGSEYGTKCSQNRLGWVVSHTPRAGFHLARGTGWRGEESAHILNHHQVRAEGLDCSHDVQP
jgi:hypothetical protein